ncbi:hypothetical protein NL676_018091 [Syzygium grande]|nr:hypothetical protein NL676_018091 [Syzygium grande]
MDARASFYLLLPFLVLLARGAGSTTLSFTNNCPYQVWPGTLTSGGGGQLSSTGFELATGSSFSINDVQDTWFGRVSCNGAGAIAPAFLVEFTLVEASSGKQDFYDIGLVDSFNLPISATPQGSGSGCSATSYPGC